MSSVAISRNALRLLLQLGVRELCESVIKKKKRAMWLRRWVERRGKLGASSTLIKELAVEDPKEYLKFMRMSELKFEELLKLITPRIRKSDTVMRQAIPCKTKLEITLRYLATGDSLKSLQYLFRVPSNTISTILPEVLIAIYDVLQTFITVPTTMEEWKNIQKEFELQWNFPNCCGALDGKHVRILRPPNSTSNFFNYKHTYSIVLFAMVDAEYCFKYIDVGSDGRANDSTIFKLNELNIALDKNLLIWPLDGLCVADDAFPLRHNLLTPFSHRELSLEERIFNYRLSRARRVSENAFGILTSRFRVFTHSIPLSVDTTESVVKAACVLHNWLRKTSVTTYFPPGSVDTEDLNTGEIIPGSWRAEVTPLLTANVVASARNYSNEVKRIRNRYAKAFMNEFAVPWQLKSIHWNE